MRTFARHIRNRLRDNRYLYFLLSLLRDVPGNAAWPADYRPGRHKKRKPKVLQLPITWKCNFDCVMCGMRKLGANADWTPEDMEAILGDDLFSIITDVGINGGEPFIKNNLPEYVRVITKALPKLKNMHFISNGWFTGNMTVMLQEIKQICKERGVRVTLGLSLDGIGKMQDFLRGKEGAFEHIEQTYNILSQKNALYYDDMKFLCCITRHNIFHVNEVEVWSAQKGIEVNYNLAALHERVANSEKYGDFSVLSDPLALQMATEFFYSKYRETKSQTYFCLYHFLRYGKRIGQCEYQYNNEVTLLPNKQLAYCSTCSREIGDVHSESAKKLFRENLNYKDELYQDRCSQCFHPTGKCNSEGLNLFLIDIIRSRHLFY